MHMNNFGKIAKAYGSNTDWTAVQIAEATGATPSEVCVAIYKIKYTDRDPFQGVSVADEKTVFQSHQNKLNRKMAFNLRNENPD